MSEAKNNFLSKLGFRFGISGPHASRTMMLDDLRVLFATLPGSANRDDYTQQVVANNVLGKPTKKSRELALRHLTALYGLDAQQAVFRALRGLWESDNAAQPLLALTAALARDTLLRSTQSFILDKPLGTSVNREDLEKLIGAAHQDRFSSASLKSVAQNLNGTWTAGGFLVGRIRKTRALPIVTPANVAFCLFLGHLEGLSGQLLFTSFWMKLINSSSDELEALVSSASHRGLLVYLNAGGVKELRFPDYLTAEEEQIRQEVSRVI